MIAVTSPGFVLFAALLAGLWYARRRRRWQRDAGGKPCLYAVLCWQALPVLLACTFLVWWCGRRTAAKGTFKQGWQLRFFRLLLKYLPAARVAGQAGQRAGHRLFYAAAYKLSLRCAPWQASAGGTVCAAAVLCLIFLSPSRSKIFNRYDELMPQMDRPARWDTARTWRGVQRSAWGYFKSWRWLTVPRL